MIQKFKNKKIERFFNFYILIFLYFYFLMFPVVSFAAGTSLNDILSAFGRLVSKAIPIVFGLALLFFFYGVALYIFRAGDEKKAKEGKSIMIYGVIALFVMLSIMGIIKFIGDNLNIHPLNVNSSSSGIIGN